MLENGEVKKMTHESESQEIAGGLISRGLMGQGKKQ